MNDASAIARIHRSARLAAMPWLPDLYTPEQDLRFFAERVLPAESVLVFDIDGTTVGFIAFASDWINHLYIAPEYWECGYGAVLLGHAKAASPHLQLWTFQGNQRARRFYAKHGFKEVERTDGEGNEEKTPDVRLAWSGAGGVDDDGNGFAPRHRAPTGR
jgi:GNAT superfamily N-acetyltransferase